MSRIAYIHLERRRREIARAHVLKSAQPTWLERIVYFLRRKFK